MNNNIPFAMSILSISESRERDLKYRDWQESKKVIPMTTITNIVTVEVGSLFGPDHVPDRDLMECRQTSNSRPHFSPPVQEASTHSLSISIDLQDGSDGKSDMLEFSPSLPIAARSHTDQLNSAARQ
jgi:hypothetical protein